MGRWPRTLQDEDLILLIDPSILTRCPCRLADPCERSTVGVEGILVLLLACQVLGIGHRSKVVRIDERACVAPYSPSVRAVDIRPLAHLP